MKQSCRKKNSRAQRFSLIIQSNPKKVHAIEGLLQQVDDAVVLDEKAMYRLLVSCTEAVNNAILHGNKSDPSKTVCIRCAVQKKAIVVVVKDEGGGFDSAQLPNPLSRANLMKENGRGVFLMRSLMDEVAFRKLKTGHEVRLVMYRMGKTKHAATLP
jgi:serine/threonine-protein kinase RsbW